MNHTLTYVSVYVYMCRVLGKWYEVIVWKDRLLRIGMHEFEYMGRSAILMLLNIYINLP